MLALLVEKVSKLSFPEFLDKKIFKPLKMEHTFAYTKERLYKTVNRAYGHVKYKKGGYKIYQQEDLLDQILGDKSIYSTIDDMLKWDQSLYNHTLVSEKLTEEAFQKGILNNNKEFNYGYGFRIREYKDNSISKYIVYHNGWWHGFKASLTRYIEDKYTVIILNNTNAHIGMIINDIEKVLFN